MSFWWQIASKLFLIDRNAPRFVGECNCSAVAAWKGAGVGDRHETRPEPANFSALARIGGRDIFGSSRKLERRFGEAVFIGPGLIHIANCVAAWLSGSQCIHACVQALDGQDASGSARFSACISAKLRCVSAWRPSSVACTTRGWKDADAAAEQL